MGRAKKCKSSDIKNLRKKVATMVPDRELVSTVYGVGYKFSYPDE